ncbi:hypothetical protein J3F83DRAFT_723888 [Trichoderma novae-zelandiae]
MDHPPLDAAVLEAIRSFCSRPSTSQRAKDGLLRFLNDDPPFSEITPILPMEEMEIRLETIEKVRKLAEEESRGISLHLNMLQVATLLVMPMDSLRYVLQAARTWPGSIDPYLAAGAFLSLLSKGKLPGGSRRASDNTSQPSSATGASSSKRMDRDRTERQKCLDRDHRSCIFTKAAHPEACHIIPFALTASQDSLEILASQRILSNALLDHDTAHWFKYFVGTTVGSSDKSWNMLSLTPTLHAWWGKALFGIKCLGIIPHDNQRSKVKLQFHWMPSHSRKPGDIIAPPYQDVIQGAAESRAIQERANIEIIADARRDSFRELESGQTFEVVVDKEDAENMKMALDVQWAVMRIQAISGAAGDWEFEYYHPDESGAAGDISTTDQVQEWLETVSGQ